MRLSAGPVRTALERLRPARAIGRLEFPYRAPTVPAGVGLPSVRSTVGADYDTDWARRFPARWTRTVLLETVVRGAVRALARPEVRGLDRLDDLRRRAESDDGVASVIFAANHHSHLDSAVLLSSLPEPWRYKVFVGAAADYFFTNKVTSAASALALNAIPIERSKVARRSAGQAEALLREGWSLVIFPEGGRSPDGWGQDHKGGAAWLATRADVAVVPVHIEGTGAILAKGDKRPSPGRSTVTFGAPLRGDGGEDGRALAVRIERSIAALADESGSDWYTARLRAHRDETPTLTGPTGGSWRRAWARGARRRGRASTAAERTLRWPDLG